MPVMSALVGSGMRRSSLGVAICTVVLVMCGCTAEPSLEGAVNASGDERSSVVAQQTPAGSAAGSPSAGQSGARSNRGVVIAGAAAVTSAGGSAGHARANAAGSGGSEMRTSAAGSSEMQPTAAGGGGVGGTSTPSTAAGAGAPASAGSAAVPPSAAAIPRPNEIHGVNWADKRDNFVDGVLQLSGLDTSKDSYDTVKTKTTRIVGQFRDLLGANTIRIPINEPTLASPWWNAYKAVIDTATEMGVNVIVAYWAHAAGKPDDEAAFKAMWQKVVSAYPDNNRVLFDIHNEPSGFSATAWRDEAARWLGYFPAIPRGRVIVAGTGSDTDVVPLGSDARFDGCILQLHYYAFWHKDWTQQKPWRDAVVKALGSYASRTIVGEWGADMAGGLDYDTKTPDGNSEIAYITAMADLIRENHMGSCYWPGLRDGDSYSLLKRDPNDAQLELTVVNASGRNRLRWSWNE